MNGRWAAWLHGERLPRLVAGGLFLLLAWLAGAWLAKALAPVNKPVLPKLHFTDPATASAVSLPASLFGQDAAPPAGPAQVKARRKVTPETLGIRLLGVISLSDGQGVAIVQLRDGQRRAVRTGEAVREGLELVQVAPDRIILSADGEMVWIPVDDGPVATAMPARPDVSPRQDVRALAEQLRHQPLKLFELVTVQPVPQGVRITPRPGNEALLEQLGLRSGDIISAVEGQPIKSLMQQPARWQELINQNHWRLRVLRDGRYEDIEVDLS